MSDGPVLATRTLDIPPAVEPLGSIQELLELVLRGEHVAEDDEAAEDADGQPAECVDQLAHALQCAHVAARLSPQDDELQIAALVHDIGHLVCPGHDRTHGMIAESLVRPLLGARVARLAALHVPAKRYLVSVESAYSGRLSEVSAITLRNQGGPMSLEEQAAFRSLPDFGAALLLRRADEGAKVPGRQVPSLAAWISALDRIARAANADDERDV